MEKWRYQQRADCVSNRVTKIIGNTIMVENIQWWVNVLLYKRHSGLSGQRVKVECRGPYGVLLSEYGRAPVGLQ